MSTRTEIYGAAYASASGVNDTNFTFTPDDNGSYQIVLTVTDDELTGTSVNQTISVANVAPTATFSNNGPVNEGSPVTDEFCESIRIRQAWIRRLASIIPMHLARRA